jgi:DNA repair exonuclease SbcCD ATPase subunit
MTRIEELERENIALARENANLEAKLEDANKQAAELEEQVANLKGQLGDCKEEIERLEEDGTAEFQDMSHAVDNFLYCVDRPVGTRAFSIRQSDETNRCILGLYDAIGRNL